MKQIVFALFMPFIGIGQNKQSVDIPFKYKTFLNLTNYFENKREVVDFFDFNKGEQVADIGAGEGKYEGAFSLLFDSVSYFVQDIDSTVLSQRKLKKVVDHYASLKPGVQSSNFQLCIGTEKCTNLSEGSFDKVVMISSLHMFTYMDDMIRDIYKKLKHGGKVYILDAHCSKKGHVNYSSEQVIAIMEKQGFVLDKLLVTSKGSSNEVLKAVFKKN